MPTQVVMPQMGESVAEGTIVRWIKKIGDAVERDEPLFEISTDKVDAEIPAPASGVLSEIKVKEGETVPVNTVVAVINGAGAQPAATPKPAAAPTPSAPAAPPAQTEQEAAPQTPAADTQSEATAAPQAAPPQAARVPQPLSAPAPATTEVGPPPYSEGDRVQIEPMSIMRRKVAERMIESHRVSAHVYSVIEVDYTETARLRDRLKGEYLERDGVKLTFLPFIIKAVIEGIKKWPIINSSVWGDQVVYKQDINVGVAVALDWGLIVPVVRNADEKSLLGLARAVNDLGDRARNKKLKPDEVQGGTFTLTNPGVFGGLMGLPIINQPQVAILGVGGIKKRPVVVDDAIAIRQIGMLSLSYDHRVVDGADADQFLAFVRDVIEKGEFTS